MVWLQRGGIHDPTFALIPNFCEVPDHGRLMTKHNMKQEECDYTGTPRGAQIPVGKRKRYISSLLSANPSVLHLGEPDLANWGPRTWTAFLTTGPQYRRMHFNTPCEYGSPIH